jgi:hypothetical protein
MEKQPLHRADLTVDEVWGYLKGVESELDNLKGVVNFVGFVLVGILLGMYLERRR